MALSKKALYFITAAVVAAAIVALTVGLVLGLRSKTATDDNTPVAPILNYRLPTELSPYHYDINVSIQFITEINNSSFPYDGEVTIYFTCIKDTTSLVLHVNRLHLDNSSLTIKSLTDHTYGEVKAFSWYNDYQRHFFIANFTKPFNAGQNYTFSVKFVGYLTNDGAGLYRSSYLDDKGNRKWLMASQMEGTDARKAFPSFDEPSFKATWKISVIHRRDYNALSNMPVERIVNIDSERVRTEFYTIPRMSSYLVALVVSDFVCIHRNTTSRALPIGSCGRPNVRPTQLDFSLDVAVRIIEYFEKLYRVNYPLPKCDHVAIPDFAAGAMENWGLVTYRQDFYLFNAGLTPRDTEQFIAIGIVHETAHMWFGDIVSPKWWNDLWLSEAIAAFNQHFGLDALNPQYQVIDQFKDLFFTLMWTDSSPSRSISADVSTPDEIDSMFDAITYTKGGSIIWTVHSFLGNDTYYKGMTRYLERYSYSSVDGEMLWNTMNEVAKEDAKLGGNLHLNEIMKTWIKQPGNPVVTIERINNRTIVITQNQFLLDPASSNASYRYYIPFTYTIEKIGTVNSDTVGLNSDNLWKKVAWFTPQEIHKIIELNRALADDDFVLANLRAAGFYRVNYDNYFLDRIIKQLLTNKDAIPVENRAQLIHDYIGFSEARIIDAEKPFDLLEYLATEDKELPWMAYISRVGYFHNMFVSTSAYGNYQKFTSNIMRSYYKKLDWEEKPTDTWVEKKIRTNIVSLSCLSGVPECVDRARYTYADWMTQENNNKIPSDYRSYIYCTAIRDGGENEYNFASRRYTKETDARERSNLLNGMSCTTRTWLISRFFDDQLSNPRVAESLAGLRAAAVRPYAILKTWNAVKENWSTLFSKYGTDGVTGLLVDFSTTFNTQFMLDDFSSFFANNTNQSVLANEIAIARNRIARNIDWYKKYFKRINEWFSNKYDAVKTISSNSVIIQ